MLDCGNVEPLLDGGDDVGHDIGLTVVVLHIWSWIGCINLIVDCTTGSSPMGLASHCRVQHRDWN
eukprot:scaffold23781_cov137-Amphora_coffeaeformis.AAC.1